MKIKPLRETIFVLPDKTIEQTAGGIILSDFNKKRPTTGTIIAIGAQCPDLKVGQRIVHGEFCGARENIEIDGVVKEIFIMQPSDVLALLE
jgi:chaperonin GroES